jgi:hypothetical protein
VLWFTLADGGKQVVVDLQLVLPSGREIKVVESQQVPVLQDALQSPDTRHQVDAFFAKRRDDEGINVHAEDQVMQRVVMNLAPDGTVLSIRSQR